MFDISVVLAVLVILLGLFFNRKILDKWNKYPPGPVGLPVVGNLHQLGAKGKTPLQVIKEWSDTYGNVVGLRLGEYRVVVLSGYETIKEAYSMMEFSGRPLLLPFHAIADGEKRGLVLSEGQAWTEQRRFALRNLRDFGFGKKSMESFIHEDIQDLLQGFQQHKQGSFVPHRMFSTAVVKSLWNIIAGERFSYGDPRFQNVLDAIHSVISSTSLTGPAFFIPWLATMLPGLTGWSNFKNSIATAKQLVSSYIKEHKESYQEDNVRDYLDVYLKEIKQTEDPNSSFYKETGEKHMLVGALNLLAAGSETTSSTMIWSLMYLINNPEVQEKLYKEITAVTGNSRMPSLEDRDSCPYTMAVMEEVLRMSSLVPLGVIHSTMEDVSFKGFLIPKDTLVLANQYGVHYDKKIWGDPDTFRPERFIDESSGKLKKSLGPVIPFSVGKRTCLGEVLARNNFFLYLTCLVQKFKFESESGQCLQVNVTPGLVRVPEEFPIVIRDRE